MMLDPILTALTGYRFRFGSEAQLHAGIAYALNEAKIAFEHEHVASERDRFDFLCGRIVIEAKIHGSFSRAIEQAGRYLEHDTVDAVIVASSRAWANGNNGPHMVGGKIIHVVRIQARSY